MDPLPREVDDYIRESIDHTLGLPVSAQTLELKKLRCSEAAKRRIEGEGSSSGPIWLGCLCVFGFRPRLCNKLEKECSLYDHDREALMDFGNEADQRAKEAELRVQELEDELREELKFYKNEYERLSVDSSAEGSPVEEKLVESVLATLTKDETGAACAFWEANS
ncbi:uncharacterized protein LOC121049208 [Rosa chinensis]|uniref:uncharacterized protein LOC121049208 n=1 Tax=Rosa chinensis TaxID=74649 RepID=UPI001AD92D4F|nr:uncharacterized protein LOC121049208 [Rosa chinensis]